MPQIRFVEDIFALVLAGLHVPAFILRSLKCAIEMEKHCREFSLLWLVFLACWKNGVIVAFSHFHLACLYYLVKTLLLRSALSAHCAAGTPLAHLVSQGPELFSQADSKGSSDLGFPAAGVVGWPNVVALNPEWNSHFLHSCKILGLYLCVE